MDDIPFRHLFEFVINVSMSRVSIWTRPSGDALRSTPLVSKCLTAFSELPRTMDACSMVSNLGCANRIFLHPIYDSDPLFAGVLSSR